MEQLASAKIVHAEEFAAREAAERQALAERAHLAVHEAGLQADAARVGQIAAENDKPRFKEAIKSEAIEEVQGVKLLEQVASQQQQQNMVAELTAMTRD